MPEFDNSYSRLVAWAKIVLPMLALGILSTLFLLSRGVDPEARIPFSEAELDDMLQQERLREPEFAGVTEDGAALAVGAAEAKPDPDRPGRASATGLTVRVDSQDGAWLTVASDQGVIDQGEGLARLEGGVALRSSTGYRVQTDAVTALFDRTLVETDGPVQAVGPPGRLDAGKMRLRVTADGRYVLDFTEGVRLVYSASTDQEGDR